MAASNDLINFDIIEAQKENVQSLPGGRSARELARIFSAGKESDPLVAPSPNDTRTLNDAIRQEYEAEVQAIDESDDPLDVYDRYVKWTLNAYPSAQATPESGLLPLLERATKSFLSSPLYKNDPRYLRLWLHYIRLFSDAPRETFAFLARHHIGEGLALFYEEFAAWLEGAGRWTQAEEVYRLGIEREARPTERLLRKFGEFQQRYEQHSQDAGPSSPALPAVRPALAAKTDPFASSASPSPDPQAQSARPALGGGGGSKTKSGKPKMAIFSDADSPASQPAIGGGRSKGWENIGSLGDRRKENKIEAKPWAGETLKAGKKAAPTQKMTIFRDESNQKLSAQEPMQPKQVPEHHVREAINPRTGRRERVFVNLEAVYPDYRNPGHEVSFEELRAMSRGWMDKDWRLQKEPLKQISGNAPYADQSVEGMPSDTEHELPTQLMQGLVLQEKKARQSEQGDQQGSHDGKAGKARKLKLREVKGETQTIKMNFDSPTKSKIRRKSTAEPTMTIHTRAATDEIYSIFNQPLKAETEDRADSLYGSDYEDDDYTSAGESTCTGRISAASSDFGDDVTNTFHKSIEAGADEFDEDDDHTQAGSVPSGEWTEFTESKHVLSPEDLEAMTVEDPEHFDDHETDAGRGRFVPEMPEDYDPPYGPYRDPAVVAQNRLPFMTPIVEQTEYSLPSMTAARAQLYNAKTPSKPMQGSGQTPPGMPTIGDLLLSSPDLAATPQQEDKFICFNDDVPPSPTALKTRASPKIGLPVKEERANQAVIKDAVCNPTDKGIRNTILQSLNPPLTSYRGYHDHSERQGGHASEIQRFVKALSKRPKSGDRASFDTPILDFPGAERSYVIRRELGAGAYAPVYLAESVDSLENYPSSESESENTYEAKRQASQLRQSPRYGLEAIKMEVGPPGPWEFYMIRTAHERLIRQPSISRAADSIIRAHEMHIFKGESFLVEDYRGQGTLLDLVNAIRNESLANNSNPEAGMDEALAMFFTVELFRTVEALHACGILHGDIKADNCLVRFDDIAAAAAAPAAPSLIDLNDDDENADPREIHYSPRGAFGWRHKGLSLIDFGRAIDMHAFAPSVQFVADWKTGKHECPEIREMRPWTHQIDLYGVAGTVHVMLFGKYIESTWVRGDVASPNTNAHSTAGPKTYRIRESLKRYWDREIWSDVFDLLLNPGADRWVAMERGGVHVLQQDENVPPAPAFPVLKSMKYLRQKMEAWLLANAEKKSLSLQIRKLEAFFAEKKRKLERP